MSDSSWKRQQPGNRPSSAPRSDFDPIVHQLPWWNPTRYSAAALEALGMQRLAPEKARRLSTLLEVRKARVLSQDEADDLNALMTEADALELEGLQRLAAAVQR